MPELTREVFVSLWSMTKAGTAPDDADLARMQKYMAMHEDMHAHFEGIAADPAASIDVDGENLVLHIAMDAATEAALERDEPDGIRDFMQSMLDSNVAPGTAFHAISQAMQHEFVLAAGRGEEMDLAQFATRAANYAAQAVAAAAQAGAAS